MAATANNNNLFERFWMLSLCIE